MRVSVLAVLCSVTLLASDFSALLSGRWIVEQNDSTFVFTRSGKVTWDIPTDIFGIDSCTVFGTYTVDRNDSLITSFTQQSDGCSRNWPFKHDLPLKLRWQGDVIDDNHLILDNWTLRRTR
jgi:hypothetical protein